MTQCDETDIKKRENWNEEKKNDEDEIHVSNDINEETHTTHVIDIEEEMDATHASHQDGIVDSAGKQSSTENSKQDILENEGTLREEVEISVAEVVIGADEIHLDYLTEEKNRSEITSDGFQKENITHYPRQEILVNRCIRKEDSEDSNVIADIMIDLSKGKDAAENGADKIVENKGIIQVEVKNGLKEVVIGADRKSFEKRHDLKEGKNSDENDKEARHSEVETFKYQYTGFYCLLLAAQILEMETIIKLKPKKILAKLKKRKKKYLKRDHQEIVMRKTIKKCQDCETFQILDNNAVLIFEKSKEKMRIKF